MEPEKTKRQATPEPRRQARSQPSSCSVSAGSRASSFSRNTVNSSTRISAGTGARRRQRWPRGLGHDLEFQRGAYSFGAVEFDPIHPLEGPLDAGTGGAQVARGRGIRKGPLQIADKALHRVYALHIHQPGDPALGAGLFRQALQQRGLARAARAAEHYVIARQIAPALLAIMLAVEEIGPSALSPTRIGIAEAPE